MATLNVQFKNSAETATQAYFAAPQDPTSYPNLGTVDASDARWQTFYDAMPVGVQAGLVAPTTAS